MKCSKCGAEITGDGSFCSECGAPIVKTEKPSKKIIYIIIAIAIAAVAATGFIVHTIDLNTLSTGTETLGELKDQLSAVEDSLSEKQAELDEIEATIEGQKKKVKPLKEIYNKSLAPGDYVVGEDLKAGIYHFTYKLRNKDAWGGDYIYVIHKGSKGKDKTLGGTKFDFRVEGSNDGEQVSIKLTYGDKVHVDSDLGGSWTPGKKPQ